MVEAKKQIWSVFNTRYINNILFQVIVTAGFIAWLNYNLVHTHTGNPFSYSNVYQKHMQLRKGMFNVDGTYISIFRDFLCRTGVYDTYQSVIQTVWTFLDGKQCEDIMQKLGPFNLQVCL